MAIKFDNKNIGDSLLLDPNLQQNKSDSKKQVVSELSQIRSELAGMDLDPVRKESMANISSMCHSVSPKTYGYGNAIIGGLVVRSALEKIKYTKRDGSVESITLTDVVNGKYKDMSNEELQSFVDAWHKYPQKASEKRKDTALGVFQGFLQYGGLALAITGLVVSLTGVGATVGLPLAAIGIGMAGSGVSLNIGKSVLNYKRVQKNHQLIKSGSDDIQDVINGINQAKDKKVSVLSERVNELIKENDQPLTSKHNLITKEQAIQPQIQQAQQAPQSNNIQDVNLSKILSQIAFVKKEIDSKTDPSLPNKKDIQLNPLNKNPIKGILKDSSAPKSIERKNVNWQEREQNKLQLRNNNSVHKL